MGGTFSKFSILHKPITHTNPQKMTENYLTFKKYNDVGLATEIGEQLKANQIEYAIEDNKQFFDATFANNSFNPDISLKLKPEDFSKAQKVLDSYYQQSTTSVDKDYYLFEFSDQELVEIISKRDEWGEFDYQLAQKILSDRGMEIKPEIVELLTEQRSKDLSKPETSSKYLIYRGYFSAFFGGFFAIIFGYNLAYSKRTMRDGQQIFTYREEERKHGERIVLIGIISTIAWIIAFLYIKLQE